MVWRCNQRNWSDWVYLQGRRAQLTHPLEFLSPRSDNPSLEHEGRSEPRDRATGQRHPWQLEGRTAGRLMSLGCRTAIASVRVAGFSRARCAHLLPVAPLDLGCWQLPQLDCRAPGRICSSRGLDVVRLILFWLQYLWIISKPNPPNNPSLSSFLFFLLLWLFL